MEFRLTMHNGRARKKDGVYSAMHNDRNFDVEKNGKHIDTERSKDNVYWNCGNDQSMSFEKIEKRFYEAHFSEALESINERHRMSRHTNRIKTMEQYRKSKFTCPEETMYQVGTKDASISGQELLKIHDEYLEWHRQNFPNIYMLDFALHMDEATPHIQERKVWIGHDENGNELVSQNKALQEMGIERPNIDRPKDRYNNPKMTYTRQTRNKLIEICMEHGLHIKTEPLEASRVGLELQEYKTRQEQEKELEARENTERLQAAASSAKRELNTAEQEREAEEKALEELKASNALQKAQNDLDNLQMKETMDKRWKKDLRGNYKVSKDDMAPLLLAVEQSKKLNDYKEKYEAEKRENENLKQQVSDQRFKIQQNKNVIDTQQAELKALKGTPEKELTKKFNISR